MRIPPLPQYFFGTFALHAVMAWFAVDALRRWRAGALAGVIYGAGCAVLTVSAMFVIHARGFERPRWPTLGNSVAIARELNRFTDTTVQTDVALLQKNPQILRALRLLLPPEPGAAQRESGRLLITVSEPELPNGKIQLIELSSDAAPPTNSQTLDVTPLPKNWVPEPGTW